MSAKHLSERKNKQVLGEIAYLCALGQSPGLVIPEILERILILIPCNWFIWTWTSRSGNLERVYSMQPSLMKAIESYVNVVEGNNLEAEAQIPTTELFSRKILFANSDSHKRTFEKSFYYNELLRPNNAYHSARFQIISEQGPIGNLFGTRPKAGSLFSEEEGAFFREKVQQHLEHLFTAGGQESAHALSESATGHLIADYSGGIALHDASSEEIFKGVGRYFDQRLWKYVSIDEMRDVTTLVAKRLALKIKAALQGENLGPATETIYTSGQAYVFSASPFLQGDKISDRYFLIKVTLKTSRQVLRLVRDSLPNLSPTERIVAFHLLDDLTYHEIGSKMEISKNTVETYVKRIFLKLNIAGRRELQELVGQL